MFIIQIPYLSLDQTFKSGQHLRWIKISDDKFIIINGSKIVKVSQNRDRFCFDCTEAEFYDTWYDYFDVGTDYLLYNYRINKIDEDFVKQSSNRGRGIRIIKQNISTNSIPKGRCYNIQNKLTIWTFLMSKLLFQIK